MSIQTFSRFLSTFHDGYVVVDKQDTIASIGGVCATWKDLSVGMSMSAERLGLMFASTSEAHAYSIKEGSYEIDGQPFTIITLTMQEINRDLLKKLSMLEQIVSSLNEGVMVSDREGRIIYYNEAQEKLENLKKEDVIGKYLWDVYRIDKDTSQHRHVHMTQTPILGQYRAHAYTQGVPQYTTYNTYPLMHEGKAIGAFSICINDTKLKDLLHETLELKRQLYKTPTNQKAPPSNGTTYDFGSIKGKSTAMTNLIREAQNMALYNTDILIVGETGTGKELFAQSIHNHSPRAQSPFIAVNCAAIPETLLESTLFGSVKGAYTGATNQIGLFEYAQDGTLFLDEINSMPLSLQSKLIRVLEERKVRRLGSNEVYPIHCHIITASNENPQDLIRENRLRLDLYYRIAKISLLIPPLRERPDDILFYIDYFLSKFNDKFKKTLKGITKPLEQYFLRYPWPGNTRELEHLMENLMIRTDNRDDYIDVVHLPLNVLDVMTATRAGQNDFQPVRRIHDGNETPPPVAFRTHAPPTEAEIVAALDLVNWNITQAAKRLGISRQNLQYHMKKLQLRRPE